MPSSTQDYITYTANKGLIEISGEERVKYLQGQVTADITKLESNSAKLSCHCDFKGKVWSVNYTLIWQDSILMLTNQTALSQSLAELNKYGVFAKVDITEQSQNWKIIAGKGATFEQAITNLFGQLPTENQGVISNEHGLVIAFTQPSARYIVLQPQSTTHTLDCEIEHSPELWEADDIQAGIADISDTTANEFVPQMLNLNALDAIDFEKGCYMGQEVIARTKYLGRNKKAGFILTGKTIKQNLTSEALEFEIDGNWRPGGKILRSASTHEQTLIFAVLANDTEIGTKFRLKSDPDVTFVTQALPYSIH